MINKMAHSIGIKSILGFIIIYNNDSYECYKILLNIITYQETLSF